MFRLIGPLLFCRRAIFLRVKSRLPASDSKKRIYKTKKFYIRAVGQVATTGFSISAAHCPSCLSVSGLGTTTAKCESRRGSSSTVLVLYTRTRIWRLNLEICLLLLLLRLGEYDIRHDEAGLGRRPRRTDKAVFCSTLAEASAASFWSDRAGGLRSSLLPIVSVSVFFGNETTPKKKIT